MVFVSTVRCSIVLFAVGCSAIASAPSVRSCDTDLECYSVSPDDPFACWRCDKSLEGGTCVASSQVRPVRTFDVSGPAIERMRAFSAAGRLTIFAQQDPAPGRAVEGSLAWQFPSGLTPEAVPLLGAGTVISQLAVADDTCLAVDHDQASAGNLCVGACTAASCQNVCETCRRPRRPALAVQPCGEADGCEKLAAYLDSDPAVVEAKWITADGASHAVPLPATLDPGCPPLALRVQQRAATQLVVAAAQSGAVTPWLGLVARTADDVSLDAELEYGSSEAGQLLELAGAAADGDDADGALLLAWIWRSGTQKHLSVALTAWRDGSGFDTLNTVYESAWTDAASVSVAFSRYGIERKGGWVVAFRDGREALALRVDRSAFAPTRAVRGLEQAADDFVVAAHPAGPDDTSPFVYIDRADKLARLFACEQ
jgi:hypothetical protein